MKNHAKLALGPLLVFGALSLGPMGDTHAGYVTDPVVESIVRGDQSYAFPAGYIRLNQPFEGLVNQVTGDNQVTGNRMISGGTHTFYLRMNTSDDAIIGKLYTVYRRTHKVYHPVTRQYLGELIHQLGVVKITDLDGNVASCKLVASFGPIGPGDHLMTFTPPEQEAPAAQAVTQTEDARGMVIDFLANRTLVGQRNVVYLDRGRNDGFRPGDVLRLYRTGGGLPRRHLGEVRVIAAEDGTSTALVTKIIAPVLIGDRVSIKTPAPVHAADNDDSLPGTEKEQVRQLAKRIDDLAKESHGQASMRVDETGKSVILSLDELIDHLYFESGEAVVKTDGQELLKQIADMVKEIHHDQQIRVEGHADSQEIGPTLRAKFPSNWELSKARATGIARYLAQEAGIDPTQITSVGYGSTQPVAPNTTEAGRQKNRRVEIVFHTNEASKGTAPKEASFTDQSIPSDSMGTTLSTVATPSLNDGGPIPTGAGGGLDSSPLPTSSADVPAESVPPVDGPSLDAPPTQSDVPVSESFPVDGKTSGLPTSSGTSAESGRF